MAKQGRQSGNQGTRDRENAPTGTSGRQDNIAEPSPDRDRQSGEGPRRKSADDEEDSSLGTRNTNR